MKLIIFSDLHHCNKRQFYKETERKLALCSIEMANKITKKIDTIKPDAAIYLGDFIEDTHDYPTDLANFKKAWHMLSDSIKVPFHWVIGNHEMNAFGYKDVKAVTGRKDLTYSVDAGGYHLVFLSLNETASNDDNGGVRCARSVSTADLEWLENDLAKNKLPCLVFTHFGLAWDLQKGNWWFHKYPMFGLLKNRRKVKKILRNHTEVKAVFSGHQHWTKKVMERGILYYLVGSLVENVNLDGVPDGVYYEVDIRDTDITVTEMHV